MAKIYESYTPSLNIVWQKVIPPRGKLSVWLANLEKLKTGDFLVRKGIINPQDASCPFCSLELESNSHILFTCRFAWSTWMHILEWWGLSAALQDQSKMFSIQWFGLVKNRKCREIWGLILGCMIWSLWYERNKINFELKTPNLHNFISSLKIRIGIWAKEMLGYNGVVPQKIIYNIDSILLQV